MSKAEAGATVQSCPACGAKVDTANAEPLARVPCPSCGEKLRVERSFDNFLLLETLGTGGMGTVYKARDTQLDRLVALKLLRPEAGSGSDPTSQLQREARVTASINHPHVVKVFSLGSDHGQFYVVMELVDRGSLDDLIEQLKRVPEERVLEIGIQIAKGLAAAQEKGLIHRDIKPANILFSDEQTAKIVDFGLAGAAEQKAETKGEIWATPYYVAPENLNNEPEDFRSDIYSLGATLFHALAGRPPIEGETNSASALRELKEKPLVLAEIAPDISHETSRTIMRMLAPNPAQRFRSYPELIKELERARKAVSPEALAMHRRLWPVFLLILLLTAGGVGAFFWWQGNRDSGAMPAESSQSGNNASLEQRYHETRKQLLAAKYENALAAFESLEKEAADQQPLLNWIRLHRGLAALLSRKPAEAERAFQEIENGGLYSAASADAPLARFFLETAKALRGTNSVPAVTARVGDADSVRAFGLLLFGLKNFELKDFTEAQRQFEQFIAAQPGGPYAWIKEYKPIAQKYLDDCRLYAAWKSQPKSTGSTRELAASLANLRDIEKKLQARGALADQLQAEEKELAAQLSRREKSENELRERQQQELLKKERPAWDAMISAYRQKISVYDFAGAREVITRAQFSEPSLKESQETFVKKAQWLIDWKARLIEDLNRAGFAGAISDVAGMQYTAIKRASATRLNVMTPYGPTEMDWLKFAPQTLLTISTSLIKKAAPAEIADRQWLSAIFANETGQPEPARALAKAASEARPEYRSWLPLILPKANSR